MRIDLMIWLSERPLPGMAQQMPSDGLPWWSRPREARRTGSLDHHGRRPTQNSDGGRPGLGTPPVTIELSGNATSQNRLEFVTSIVTGTERAGRQASGHGERIKNAAVAYQHWGTLLVTSPVALLANVPSSRKVGRIRQMYQQIGRQDRRMLACCWCAFRSAASARSQPGGLKTGLP